MTATTFHIPTLTTERLVLRAPALSDADILAAFFASDHARFVGGPKDRMDSWRHLATEIGHWALRGYGRWTVTLRSNGAAVGIVGPWCPEGWPEPEIGWDIFEGFEGNGYGTEAARAALEWAYAEAGWRTAISLVDPENVKSAALARRLGASLEDTFDHARFGPLQVWRHKAPQSLAEAI